MKTRLSKASAAALLAVVLSLSVAPTASAAVRDDREAIGVRDRIVRFVRDIQNFFNPRSLADLLTPPH